jgi:hypothetical protein
MISRPVIVGIAFAGVAVAAVGTYSYKQVQQQRSLRHGIAQTEQSLHQVDNLLQDNQTELLKLLGSLGRDVGVNLEKLGTGPEAEGAPPFSKTPLGDAVDVFDSASNGLEGAKAFQKGDYLKALGQTAEVVASVWGKSPDWSGRAISSGKAAIDLGADLYEAQGLLFQQARLIEIQIALQQQLFRLQGKDPETLAQWQQILNNLNGDPATQHAAFSQWLAAHGLSEKDVVAKALANAADAGPGVASQVASGMTIVDPGPAIDDLSGIPNINPDFIAGLKCAVDGMRDIMNGGDGSSGDNCPRCRAGDPCDRYPDGSYINAFGPPSYDPARLRTSNGPTLPGLFRSRRTGTSPSELATALAPDPSATSVSMSWKGMNDVATVWVDPSPSCESGVGNNTCAFQQLGVGETRSVVLTPGQHRVKVRYGFGSRVVKEFTVTIPPGQRVPFTPPVGHVEIQLNPECSGSNGIMRGKVLDARGSETWSDDLGYKQDLPPGQYTFVLDYAECKNSADYGSHQPSSGNGNIEKVSYPFTIQQDQTTRFTVP